MHHRLLTRAPRFVFAWLGKNDVATFQRRARIVLPVVLSRASILRRALNPKAWRSRVDRPLPKMSVYILLRFRRRKILERLRRLWAITGGQSEPSSTRARSKVTQKTLRHSWTQFDGVMLGPPDAPSHLESTKAHGHLAGRARTADNLLLFYLRDEREWNDAVARMKGAGDEPVSSLNPYWDQHGVTFEDPDGS